MSNVLVRNGMIYGGKETMAASQSLSAFMAVFDPALAKVYTTARTTHHGQKLFGLQDHLNRLTSSLNRLGDTDGDARAQLDAVQVRNLLFPSLRIALTNWAKSGFHTPAPDGRVTVLMWHGNDPAADQPHMAVRVDPLPTYPESVAVELRPAGGRADATLKSSRWVEQRRQLEAVKAPDAHETILMDTKGNCYEGLSSNFAVLMMEEEGKAEQGDEKNDQDGSQDDSQKRRKLLETDGGKALDCRRSLVEADEGSVLPGTVMKLIHGEVWQGAVRRGGLSVEQANRWRGGAFIASTTRGVLPVHELRVFDSVDADAKPSKTIELGPPAPALVQLRQSVLKAMELNSEWIVS